VARGKRLEIIGPTVAMLLPPVNDRTYSGRYSRAAHRTSVLGPNREHRLKQSASISCGHPPGQGGSSTPTVARMCSMNRASSTLSRATPPPCRIELSTAWYHTGNTGRAQPSSTRHERTWEGQESCSFRGCLGARCGLGPTPIVGERTRTLIAASGLSGPCHRMSALRQSRTSSWRLRLADSRQERKAQLVQRRTDWCRGSGSPRMGARGAFLETDPRGELLDRAELEVCLDIIGAAALVTHRPPPRRRTRPRCRPRRPTRCPRGVRPRGVRPRRCPRRCRPSWWCRPGRGARRRRVAPADEGGQVAPVPLAGVSPGGAAGGGLPLADQQREGEHEHLAGGGCFSAGGYGAVRGPVRVV